MAVCGDAPELGAWDVHHCPRLEYIASAGRPIRFKFVVLRPSGQQPVFENLVCRTFLLPRDGSVKLDLDWDRQ